MTSIQTQITFRGFDHSDALEDAINERLAWLAQFHPRLGRARVLVTLPHRHHRGGKRFQVRIEMKVPGTPPLVVRAATSLDAHVAVHEAFDVARRRLEDLAREQRGDVKSHVMQPSIG
jgi:ribosome-associated translation inhibitor RaiA